MLWRLGLAQRDLGERHRADTSWRHALVIFQQLGAPQAADVRRLLDDPGGERLVDRPSDRPPQSASTSQSPDSGWLACSSNSDSSIRCMAWRISTGLPSSPQTTNVPSTRNLTQPPKPAANAHCRIDRGLDRPPPKFRARPGPRIDRQLTGRGRPLTGGS